MPGSYKGGSHATPASQRKVAEVPEPVADEVVEVEDLSVLTVAALRVIAQELDVPRYAKLRKAELVRAIEVKREAV